MRGRCVTEWLLYNRRERGITQGLRAALGQHRQLCDFLYTAVTSSVTASSEYVQNFWAWLNVTVVKAQPLPGMILSLIH